MNVLEWHSLLNFVVFVFVKEGGVMFKIIYPVC